MTPHRRRKALPLVQQTTNDDVAHAVGDETHFLHAVEMANDVVQGRRMLADVGHCGRIADVDDGQPPLILQIVRQPIHELATGSKAVQHHHHV